MISGTTHTLLHNSTAHSGTYSSHLILCLDANSDIQRSLRFQVRKLTMLTQQLRKRNASHRHSLQ
jgi:hypothetical protein